MLIVTALVKTHRTLKGRVCTPLDPIVGLLNHFLPSSFNILFYDPCPDLPSVFLLSSYPSARTHVLVLIVTFEYQRKCKICSKTVNLV